jgi:hypothetical protein
MTKLSLVCVRNDGFVPAASAIGSVTENWQQLRINQNLPILRVESVQRSTIKAPEHLYLNRGFTITFVSVLSNDVTRQLLKEVAIEIWKQFDIDYMLLYLDRDKRNIRRFMLDDDGEV